MINQGPSIFIEREEAKRRLEEMNLMDHHLMPEVLQDFKVCEHVIRTLTEQADLQVKNVQIEYQITSALARNAILDVLAEDSEGKLYNIEIQRADTPDHARRVRFYQSAIDRDLMKKGSAFNQLPDLYMIYLSEKDIWKTGETIEEVEMRLNKSKKPYQNGLRIIFCNTEIDDGSTIASLLQDFKESDPDKMTQDILAERVRYLKRGGGFEYMEARLYDWELKALEQGIEQGIEQGDKMRAQKSAQKLKRAGWSDEEIINFVEYPADQVKSWLVRETE